MGHYKNNIAKTLIKICNVSSLSSENYQTHYRFSILYCLKRGRRNGNGILEYVHPALKFLNDNNS